MRDGMSASAAGSVSLPRCYCGESAAVVQPKCAGNRAPHPRRPPAGPRGRPPGPALSPITRGMLTVDPHRLLDLKAFVTLFPRPLGETASTADLLALLAPGATAPLCSDDAVREAVRQLLRQGGFKPTGRSKPASEYLLKATAEGRLGPINVAVDACNVASLHSGLPISVVDLDRAREPFRVGVAPAGAEY